MTHSDLLIDGPADATWTLALAHGAGQNMRSGFMNHFATGLADAGQSVGGLRVVRFEFPYMARSQKEGIRRPPDRETVLLDCWRSVLAILRESGTASDRTVIGGKSLGARMASLICDAERVAGLVCLGFPFHPPGKSDSQRIAHLRAVTTPTLICQGERDTFGSREDVAGYDLPANIRVHWLIDGDHGFKPRMASGRSEIQNWQESIEAIVGFTRGLA